VTWEENKELHVWVLGEPREPGEDPQSGPVFTASLHVRK